VDKPGVGKSQGNCAQTDFQTELGSCRAAFDSISKYPFVDQSAVFVIGLSNGGGTAPLTAGQHPVRGYIAASSWGRTWYAHMLENKRVRLTKDKKLSAAEINDSMRAFTDFYSLYLIRHMSPGEIIARIPDGKGCGTTRLTGNIGARQLFISNCKI
jgi:alpha-beta hydrolase superfamily lysophospholipase